MVERNIKKQRHSGTSRERDVINKSSEASPKQEGRFLG